MKTKTSIPCFMNGEMIQFPHSFSILSLAIPEKPRYVLISLEREAKWKYKFFETKVSIKERRKKGC